MKIERERVRETFREYTDAYDADREGRADGEDRG